MKRLHPIFRNEAPTIPNQFSKGEWSLVECRETGLVYLENPPEYEDLSEDFAWEKTFAEEKERRKEEEPVVAALSESAKKARAKLHKWARIERESFLLLQGAYRKKLAPVTMVDVGCGEASKTSRIIKHMRSEYQVPVEGIGVEISAELARQADARLKKVGGRAIHAPAVEGLESVEDQSIDLVVLCSFLEHEIAPLDLLEAARDKLSSHGNVIIKVPNYACLNRRFRKEKWCGFRYPDHVNYFTPKTLRLIIEKAGLKVTRMNFFDRLPTNDNMYAIATRA